MNPGGIPQNPNVRPNPNFQQNPNFQSNPNFQPNPNFVSPSAPQTQTTTTTNKPVKGKTRGETVSLRLEMAAYFRRPNVQPVQVETSSQ
jgi:hypothetical protein